MDSLEFHYRKADDNFRKMLDNARKSGQVLLEAKELVPHGEWTEWLEENFCEKTGASIETARVYMKIARHWDEISTKAQKRNIDLDSIQTFLSFFRKDTTK